MGLPFCGHSIKNRRKATHPADHKSESAGFSVYKKPPVLFKTELVA
jgi:hypothetical protein